MTNILFFDTETTGLPDWKSPSGSESQPHIVQLGAILCDQETQEVKGTLDLVVRPDGWEIPEEVSAIHGITTEIAMEKGIPETEALELFLGMWGGSKRVAHNRTFDQRIIRIALKRYRDEETQERWANKDDFECTMMMAKPIMALPPRNRYGLKNPKLKEAYQYFTGKTLENAHTAMADAEACMEIYFALMARVVEEAS